MLTLNTVMIGSDDPKSLSEFYTKDLGSSEPIMTVLRVSIRVSFPGRWLLSDPVPYLTASAPYRFSRRPPALAWSKEPPPPPRSGPEQEERTSLGLVSSP